jgi:adenylate cyclase class IV
MPKELKIRLTNRAATEQKLRELGATFAGEKHSTHTYFTQPAGHVLKIAESDGAAKLIRFRREGDGFVKVASDPIDDPVVRKAELAAELGVDSELDMRSRTYMLDGYQFETYQIAGLGDFLIQTADDPDPAYFTKLDIAQAEYVKIPFNELAKILNQSDN